jgi:hypothetical protein
LVYQSNLYRDLKIDQWFLQIQNLQFSLFHFFEKGYFQVFNLYELCDDYVNISILPIFEPKFQ